MSKRKSLMENSRERRELEEISHLYFSSDVSTAEDTQDVSIAPEVSPKPQPPSPAAFWPLAVCAAVRPQEYVKALSFLHNLAILLKISNEPGLLVCSEQGYQERFCFNFRPDREKWPCNDQEAFRSGVFGPMGIRLIDLGTMKRVCGESPARPAEGCTPLWDGVPFHYILSDEPSADFLFEALPGLILFLISPDTPEGSFSDLEEAMWLRERLLPPRAGIVIADVACKEEARKLYSYWRELLQQRHPHILIESYGVLPWSGCRDGGEAGYDTRVLEDPSSIWTRLFQGTVSLIRKARAEMLSVIRDDPGQGSRDIPAPEVMFRTGIAAQEEDRLGSMLIQM